MHGADCETGLMWSRLSAGSFGHIRLEDNFNYKRERAVSDYACGHDVGITDVDPKKWNFRFIASELLAPHFLEFLGN